MTSLRKAIEFAYNYGKTTIEKNINDKIIIENDLSDKENSILETYSLSDAEEAPWVDNVFHDSKHIGYISAPKSKNNAPQIERFPVARRRQGEEDFIAAHYDTGRHLKHKTHEEALQWLKDTHEYHKKWGFKNYFT